MSESIVLQPLSKAMTYQQTLDYLYSSLPMYSRIGKAAYKADLGNTIRLCRLLGNPENKFRSIHIAGTNGKGSTSHMLAAILQKAGYKTGLYTSPHLKDFRERIRINGEMISEQEVVDFVREHKEEVLKIGCSFFEWTVGLAFDHFAKHQVDIAVIETGMGGRLDSTNVIYPVFSVITNISYDHTDILGDTIEKIAFEKAGIIKELIPVVIGESDYETENLFKETAEKRKAPIYFADQNFQVQKAKGSETSSSDDQQQLIVRELRGNKEYLIQLDLTGSYQENNLRTVMQVIDLLRNNGWRISDENLIQGLASVKQLTGLRGRWDIISRQPLIIADVAHNEAGLRFSIHHLKKYNFSRIHFVLGFVKEKDLSKILPLFPHDAFYYFCAPAIDRAMNPTELSIAGEKKGLHGNAYPSVPDAVDEAKKNAAPSDLIYIGGSTFVVAEAI